MTGMIRSFVAVPLPETVKMAIRNLQTRLKQSISGIRWTRPDNLHLTLRFLGDQPEDSLEKLAETVLSVGDSSYCFQLTFSGVDAFPSWHRGRVLWLGLAQPGLVSQLHQKLTDGLLQIGIPEDPRPFRPHLTIGRCRQLMALPQLPADARSQSVAEFRVDRLVLYQSRLTPQGARHTELCTARLRD
jgi:RNA 2',3'-cyclic 3'-phosphodiesterase